MNFKEFYLKEENIERIYHVSPDEITKINKSGTFGDVLFFSSSPYAMGHVGAIYALDIDSDNIIDVSMLDDERVLDDIIEYFGVSEETAQLLLNAKLSVWDIGYDADADWYIQRKQGEAAKNMGYDGATGEDEQGTVYIIPMFGREKDLIKIDKETIQVRG